MTLQVFEFDPAIYLDDEAAIEAFLGRAIATGDAAEIEDAHAAVERARTRLAQAKAIVEKVQVDPP